MLGVAMAACNDRSNEAAARPTGAAEASAAGSAPTAAPTPAPAPAPKKPRSDRPFWIPDDADWKVVTDLGATTFAEAVRTWQNKNPNVSRSDCFWKFYGRTCMNKSCPACK
mgnify:CR=1 FL=1